MLQYIVEHQKNIIGVFGFLGKGKSLTAIALSVLLSEMYDRKILTNTPIKYKNVKQLVYYDQLDDLHDTILLIDEMHIVADSRKHTTKENFFTSNIITDVRKFNNVFIYTTIRGHLIEKRIRDITELLIQPNMLSRAGALHNECLDISEFLHFTEEISLGNFFDIYDTHFKPNKLIWEE